MKLTKARLSTLVVVLAGMLGMSGMARAEDAGLGVALDATYVSKYLWRGYDLFDDHAAFQPSVDFDLFGTGFGVNVWGSIPMGSGNGINAWQEYDYTLYYGTTLMEDETFAVDFGANYIYFDFPKLNSEADTQEFGVSAALPNLIAVGELTLVPSYYVGKLWPTDSGVSGVSGWYHSFALATDIAIPGTEYALSLSSDINYNDGLFGSDHDWSHMTFTAGTSFDVGPVSVGPFVAYQVSMDDSVNDEDEFYGGVSVSYSF